MVSNLNNENGTLRDQMRQTEKDTLDVISFLKKQDLDKDAEVNYYHHLDTKSIVFLNKQIERLHQELKDLQVENAKETDELVCISI